jgi:predicted DNA binding CopG/RHH family protein
MDKKNDVAIVPEFGTYYDDEEREIYEAIERDDYNPVSLLTPELRARHAEYARNTLNNLNKQRTKISLRIANGDLLRLKAQAMREGMPYQTLIGSILHKAVSR